MININYGKNKELMMACKPLSDYAWFIAEIRKYKETMEIESAVDHALESMPEDSLLKDFLTANKAEVKQMCITEYNEAETMEQFREEGRKEGQEGNCVSIKHRKYHIRNLDRTQCSAKIQQTVT